MTGSTMHMVTSWSPHLTDLREDDGKLVPISYALFFWDHLLQCSRFLSIMLKLCSLNQLYCCYENIAYKSLTFYVYYITSLYSYSINLTTFTKQWELTIVIIAIIWSIAIIFENKALFMTSGYSNCITEQYFSHLIATNH